MSPISGHRPMSLDAERITELVDRYAAALRALACTWSDTPDDLVQEAYCRLLAQRRTPEKPGAWLFQVVRNLARDQSRRESRRAVRESCVARPEAVALDAALQLEARDAAKLVMRLAPELYEVVVMRLWGGLTLQETAEVCGVSIATVHRRYHEALEELRQWMKVSPPQATPNDSRESNCS